MSTTTLADPMRDLFAAGETEVVLPDDAREAVRLAGLMSLLISLVSVVGSAVIAVVLLAVAAAPLLYLLVTLGSPTP